MIIVTSYDRCCSARCNACDMKNAAGIRTLCSHYLNAFWYIGKERPPYILQMFIKTYSGSGTQPDQMLSKLIAGISRRLCANMRMRKG